MLLEALKIIGETLEIANSERRMQEFNSRPGNVQVRISVGKKSTSIDRLSNDVFGFDEPKVTMSPDLLDMEHELAKMVTRHIRIRPGFSNRTAEAVVKLNSEGMKVRIIRGNTVEKHKFNVNCWGSFGLSDKFDARRIGIDTDTMESIERLYK